MVASCPREYAFMVSYTNSDHDQPTHFRLAFNSTETAQNALQVLADCLHLQEDGDIEMLKLVCTVGAVVFQFLHSKTTSAYLNLSPCSCSHFHAEVLDLIPRIQWPYQLAPKTETLRLTTFQAGTLLETASFLSLTSTQAPPFVSLMSHSSFDCCSIRDVEEKEITVTRAPLPDEGTPLER